MKQCKDEVIAVVEVNESVVSIRRPFQYPDKFVGIDSYLKYRTRYCRPILVLTESPHIDEFNVGIVTDFSSGQAVSARPVNGVTGDNIMLKLVGLLKATKVTLSDGYYPVIVINALQEQCSEGDRDTGKYRTRNFIRLWNKKKSYLEERLRKIDPTIVFCSCTVGDFNLASGTNAYSKGNRMIFENHFRNLLESEFGLVPSTNNSPYSFLGSLDLSGLVANVVFRIFDNRDTHLFKTTHPSSWGRRPPNLNGLNAQISFSFEHNKQFKSDS